MARLSPSELADRSGVEKRYVERLIDLGLLEQDDDGSLPGVAVRRVRVAQGLEAAGLPLERLGQAVRSGAVTLDFIDAPSYERWTSLSDVTFEELSRETGVPLELMTVIREAMGFAKPEPYERLREDELHVVPLLRLQHQHGFRPQVIERALRVYGESMRRVAETESDWWRSEVMMPVVEAGGTTEDLSASAEKLSPDLAEATDQAVLAIYHGQQTNAWMRNLLEGFEVALENAGIYEAPERVPAMCFLDLTGYTRLTEEKGDDAAVELTRNLSSVVRRYSILHGGTVVKWLGDGVMFHFPDPGRGVLASLDMVEAVAELGLPPAHVGLHAGPVLFQEGDYFGRTVNIASRIAEYARPGEVLVSEALVRAASGEEVVFSEIGPVELKGVSEPLVLFTARRAG